MIVILVGKSGAGKTTVAKNLEKMFGYKRVVTYTTRPPRKGEVDGVDYWFIPEDDFFMAIMNDELMEYQEYESSFGKVSYGSSKLDFRKKYLKEDEKNRVIVLNPEGVLNVLKTLDFESSFIEFDDIEIFYLDVSDSVLQKRLEKRGDDDKEISRRLTSDAQDIKKIEHLIEEDKIHVINGEDDVESICKNVKETVKD